VIVPRVPPRDMRGELQPLRWRKLATLGLSLARLSGLPLLVRVRAASGGLRLCSSWQMRAAPARI